MQHLPSQVCVVVEVAPIDGDSAQCVRDRDTALSGVRRHAHYADLIVVYGSEICIDIYA